MQQFFFYHLVCGLTVQIMELFMSYPEITTEETLSLEQLIRSVASPNPGKRRLFLRTELFLRA